MDIPTLLAELKSVQAINTATLIPWALSELIHTQQHDHEVLRALTQGRLHEHAVYEDAGGFILRKVERSGMPSLLQTLYPVSLR